VPVQHAVALLVGTELWGFITPSTVDLSFVRNATAKVQPYYAVPSQYLAIDEFPTTRNGKVDKRALAGLAETEKCVGLNRLSVRNGGVPFNPTLPGTPASINEQSSFKWTIPETMSLPSPDSLSPLPSSRDLIDTQPADQGQSAIEEGLGSPYPLNDLPRMIFVNAI
jgi:hypothetical protein